MRRQEVNYADYSIIQFLQEVACGQYAPGGGCVTALVGALCTALIEMITNLTVDRKKYAAYSDEMKMVRTEVSLLREDLIHFIDDDAKSIQRVLDAQKMPDKTEEERKEKKTELEQALYNASLIPLNVARKCLETFAFVDVVIKRGNVNAATDAKVAAVLLRSAIYGAIYNVQTNIDRLADSSLVFELSSEIQDILLRADEFERRAIHHRKEGETYDQNRR
ncbi:MAG: cyclodeaminase/cyclohydrolase family protein [Tissierellia bacterium]|jgi:formiminotetrahydrofolate cyclodeaminase|nr:cyclodeaminase/cyclohydrolase family protein [Bacillota bacterium]NLL23092.1 cyclodeaminase/cyclohydrolase family protein [Tissierellia bacterium]